MRLRPWDGAIRRWTEDRAEGGGITVWHVAERDTDGFAPSDAPFMIDYRVDDPDGLLTDLRAAGVEVREGPESHDARTFAWFIDPEGNEVGLREPKPWDAKNKGA